MSTKKRLAAMPWMLIIVVIFFFLTDEKCKELSSTCKNITFKIFGSRIANDIFDI